MLNRPRFTVMGRMPRTKQGHEGSGRCARVRPFEARQPVSRPAAEPLDAHLWGVTAAHVASDKVRHALAPAGAGAFAKTHDIAIELTNSRACCHSRDSCALTHVHVSGRALLRI